MLSPVGESDNRSSTNELSARPTQDLLTSGNPHRLSPFSASKALPPSPQNFVCPNTGGLSLLAARPNRDSPSRRLPRVTVQRLVGSLLVVSTAAVTACIRDDDDHDSVAADQGSIRIIEEKHWSTGEQDSVGRALVTGTVRRNDGGPQLGVWRLLADGTLDAAFGEDGAFSTPPLLPEGRRPHLLSVRPGMGCPVRAGLRLQ